MIKKICKGCNRLYLEKVIDNGSCSDCEDKKQNDLNKRGFNNFKNQVDCIYATFENQNWDGSYDHGYDLIGKCVASNQLIKIFNLFWSGLENA